VHDVAVIGGGIIGTSAAAFLAEAGASVVLFEQSDIGAGASGRNSGAIQHPYDHTFAQLHRASLPLYHDLAAMDPDFKLPTEPDGLLLVTPDAEAAQAEAAGLLKATPELHARFVAPDEMAKLEPSMAARIAGVWLDTGYAVAPASAAQAFARRAKKAGAEFRIGRPGSLDAARSEARKVLVAAGPWSVDLIPGWAQKPPITRSWGVVVTIGLASPPRRILEELSIDASGSEEPFAFSLMTAGSSTSLGSTFLDAEPDPAALVDQLQKRGRWFVPGIEQAEVLGVRLCARPVPFDGRPLIGPVPGLPNVYVCAGHGPWGISTGPGSARLIADVILGDSPDRIPPRLAPSRFGSS
jgi:glycine/D-amino acid oxidase-like deaminating enzyme